MLSAFLSGIWSRVTGYAVAIGAALAILFAAYRKGRKDSDARQDATRLNEINKARKVEHEVDGLDSGAVSERLGRWMRD